MKEPYDRWLSEMADRMCRKDGGNLVEIWSQGVEIHLTENMIPEKERQRLMELGSFLGHADIEMQIRYLDRYLEEGYIEKYPNVIIYTPDHVLTYRIFAAVIYDDRHLINSFNYVMDDQRQAFLDSLQDSRDLRNRYSDIESVGTEDRILSLSTCVTGESNHRLLVEAVLTNEE